MKELIVEYLTQMIHNNYIMQFAKHLSSYRKMSYYFFFLLLFINICLVIVSCSSNREEALISPKAINGVIDLRDWDFTNNELINLDGEWGFLWQELTNPEEIIITDQTVYVQVPDMWSNYSKEGLTTSAKGFATFFLTVLLPDTNTSYGMFVEGEGSSHTLWANNRLLAQSGSVGKTRQEMIPQKLPESVFLTSEAGKISLVMQISNFHHRKGGFRNSLSFGIAGAVHNYQIQSWFVEALSVGILFIMGLYHLFIYVFRRKNKSALYFSLLCWFICIRIGITNQNSLLIHLPFISWTFAFYLEYLIFFTAPALFSLFLKSMYPEDIHRWFIKLVFGISICFSLFTLFAGTFLASFTTSYYQIVILIEMIYYLYFLGRIIIKRREGALFIGIATLIAFTTVIVETLFMQNILPFGKIAPFGFMAYIFVQAILLSNRLSKSFTRVESLTVELEGMNVSLKQSESKYRNIFENSKDMIFIAARDTRIEDANPACEEILGYTKKELQKMKILDVLNDSTLGARFRKIIVSGKAIRNYEVELIKKNNQKIDTLVSLSLRYNEDGKTIGFQGSVRDNSDRKNAEAEHLRALKFEQISITDPLTKIYNRRFFSEVAAKELDRIKRNKGQLSIIMFDVDLFKQINDTFGHLVGDDVLISISRLCEGNIRTMDIFARFGGEEFVILMPGSDTKAAYGRAEKLRNIIEENTITTAADEKVSVTISCGTASLNPETDINIMELLDRADQALYLSKESGRNRVTAWSKIG